MKTERYTANRYAYILNRGRAWVEFVDTFSHTAIVRFDCGTGARSAQHTVSLSQVDFTREYKF